MKMLKLKRAFGPGPGRRHWLEPKMGKQASLRKSREKKTTKKRHAGRRLVGILRVFHRSRASSFFFFCFYCFDVVQDKPDICGVAKVEVSRRRREGLTRASDVWKALPRGKRNDGRGQMIGVLIGQPGGPLTGTVQYGCSQRETLRRELERVESSRVLMKERDWRSGGGMSAKHSVSKQRKEKMDCRWQ
ncbi:uncharacterized protein CTRU02_208039 [Colletotrichum truncatum]|uniref:Uncharacterized protein n=1 Tax=Colletotrichum truncatum TaxID=5467 RepID=A0ACC3YV65_COLTU|nr:uncharacterized protein CTRU02_10961 [Colletotrichum truncatum]KAF6786463.1 hypothetical protein CTRU02_10961 [Colletotrichum truncatum]